MVTKSNSSMPGCGVRPAVVVVVRVGSKFTGTAPVVKVWSASLKEEPSAKAMTPRMW